METLDLTEDFNKGVIKQSITTIPNKLLDGAFEAIMEAAYLMKGHAQVGVRVDYGNLRDNIRVERGGERLHWRQVRVRAGGYPLARGPRAGKLCDYAAIVEAKYPYMQPAWDQVSSQVETIIRRKCLEHVHEVEAAGVLRFPQ